MYTGVQQPGAGVHEAGGTCARLVKASHRISLLPAVPTQDWCQRAAAALAELLPAGVGVVSINEVLPAGTVVAPWIGGVGGADDFGNQGTAHNLLIELRCQLEGVAGVTLDHGPIGSGSTPVRVAPAAETGVLQAGWHALGIHTVVLGSIPMSPHGPHLMAAVGSSIATPDEATAAALGAVLPLIAEVARGAIGCEKRRESDWVTVREQEVLDLLVMGYSVREVAAKLSRSPYTVHDHVKSLHRKLHASSRGELVALALGRRPEPAHASGVIA